jgi:hypothetical protein
MAINGFQLSQAQGMDSGSRTKSPDDNRDAMERHENVRNTALYGKNDLLNDNYQVHIGGGPGESKEIDSHAENTAIIDSIDSSFPSPGRLVRRSGTGPRFFDNIFLRSSKQGPRINGTDLSLNRMLRNTAIEKL